jgi:uncharacterized membrane-anchored protein
MNSRAEDGPRARNGAPPVSASIVPAFSAAFWAYWLLAAMAGAIAGQALNHVYVHRSGRVIVVLMLCFLAMSMVQGTTRRLPRLMFWTAAFLLGLIGAVLAEATDVSMGIGDIGAVLLIAILLIFSFVICYRLTGHLPGPTDGSNVRGFFWTAAMLAQTAASACADWILDPGGPPERVAIAVIALGIAATIGLYLCTRVPRAVLFWSAFVLSGTVAALGGHFVMKSIECSAQHAGASCRFSATGPINQTAGWSKAVLARIEPRHPRQSPIPRGITKTDFGSEGCWDVVRSEGLEPPRCYSLPPQGSASTNSATSAWETGGLRRAGSTARM